MSTVRKQNSTTSCSSRPAWVGWYHGDRSVQVSCSELCWRVGW